MSVHERKMFQCSNCNEKFKSKIGLESHCIKEHDRSKLKRKNQIPARFCEPEQTLKAKVEPSVIDKKELKKGYYKTKCWLKVYFKSIVESFW